MGRGSESEKRAFALLTQVTYGLHLQSVSWGENLSQETVLSPNNEFLETGFMSAEG